MPDDYVMKAIPKAMVDMADNDIGQQFLDKIADEGAVGDDHDHAGRARQPRDQRRGSSLRSTRLSSSSRLASPSFLSIVPKWCGL